MSADAGAGSAVPASPDNYTFNYSLLDSAGGGSTNGNSNYESGGSGVRPLTIIAYSFTNVGIISNQGQSISVGSQDSSGGGGGGIIQVLYEGSYTNEGTFNVSGGAVSDTSPGAYVGGNGGKGKALVFEVGPGIMNKSNVYPLFTASAELPFMLEVKNNADSCSSYLPNISLHVTQTASTSFGNVTLINQNFPMSALGTIYFYLYNTSDSTVSFYFYNSGQYNVNSPLPLSTSFSFSNAESDLETVATPTVNLSTPKNPINQININFNEVQPTFNFELMNSPNATSNYTVYNTNDSFSLFLEVGVYMLTFQKQGYPPSEYTFTNIFDCGRQNNLTIYPGKYFYVFDGINTSDPFIYSSLTQESSVTYNNTKFIIYNNTSLSDYNYTINDSTILNSFENYTKYYSSQLNELYSNYNTILSYLRSTAQQIGNNSISFAENNSILLSRIYSLLNTTKKLQPFSQHIETVNFTDLYPNSGELTSINRVGNTTYYNVKASNKTNQSFKVSFGTQEVQISITYHNTLNITNQTAKKSSPLSWLTSGVISISSSIYNFFSGL